MLKKIGLPLVALLALLVFVHPTPAQAGVRIGVAIGGGYPVAAVPYAYGYAAPYYAAPYAGYGYAAPVYPYVGVGVGYYGRVGYRGYYGPRYGYGYSRGYYGGRYVGGYRSGYRR